VSDDGDATVVVIAMLGNVFSPRYFRARQVRGLTSPLDFSAMNVALVTRRASSWVMTERGAHAVERSADHLRIGTSSLSVLGDELVVSIDERSAPWGARLRGTIRFSPLVGSSAELRLDRLGRHVWTPLSPYGRISVELDEPRLRFTGTGYFDANAGAEPLEHAFSSWSWSRFGSGDGATVAYDVRLRDGTEESRGVLVDRHGVARPLTDAASAPLPSTRFGLPRHARTRERATVRLVRTLEDGPFYARSLLASEDGGRRMLGVHETVSLDRFAAPWVRFLLPFRMRVEAS
jgi:carotenoid 1,2-hydratase